MLFGSATAYIRTNNCSSLAKQLQVFDEVSNEATAVVRQNNCNCSRHFSIKITGNVRCNNSSCSKNCLMEQLQLIDETTAVFRCIA